MYNFWYHTEKGETHVKNFSLAEICSEPCFFDYFLHAVDTELRQKQLSLARNIPMPIIEGRQNLVLSTMIGYKKKLQT